MPEDGRARSVGTTVARAAGIIAIATLFARVAGFARTLVFSESVGASEVGSVYQSVNVLPNVVFEIAAGGVLAAAAVPLIAGPSGPAGARTPTGSPLPCSGGPWRCCCRSPPCWPWPLRP